jgi:hypothetical protein
MGSVLTYLTSLALSQVSVARTKLTDTGRCGCRVNNFLGTVLPDTDIGLLVLVLLGNKWRDIRLETSGTNTHDDKTKGEDGDGSAGLSDNLGNGREDKEDVTDDGDDVGVLNGEVTSPVLISKPRTSEGGDVGPKLVDCIRLEE